MTSELARLLKEYEEARQSDSDVGEADNCGNVAGDQLAQHQLLGDAVDDRQVRQRLTGHLGDRLAGHQRVDLQAVGNLRRGAQHHTLQYHAHMTVIDFAENFAQHFFERYAHK